MTNQLRTECPQCRTGCDACFIAGRSHEVDVLRTRAQSAEHTFGAARADQVAGRMREEISRLQVRNQRAHADRLGLRIHRIREQRNRQRLESDEVRRINKAIQQALVEAQGELIPSLSDLLHKLDRVLMAEAEERRLHWEQAKQRRTT